MKKLFISGLLLVGLAAVAATIGGPTVGGGGGAPAASQAEVTTGTISNKYVSPATLAGYSLAQSTGSVSSVTVTQIVNAAVGNYVEKLNGRGTNATFYIDSGAWFLAEQYTGLHFLGYDNSAWVGGTDALISEVPYTNTVGIGGNGQYLFALNGTNISDGTIPSNKLAFAIGSGGGDSFWFTNPAAASSVSNAYMVKAETFLANSASGYGLVGTASAGMDYNGTAIRLKNVSSRGFELFNGSINALKINDTTPNAIFSHSITATNGYASGTATNLFFVPSNAPTAGQVIVAVGTAGHTAWSNAPGGATGGAYSWTNNVAANEYQLTDVSTVMGTATGATDGTLILTSDPTSSSTIHLYGPTGGFGAYYSAAQHIFYGPVNMTNVSGALDVAGNVTATGTSNYVASLHTDTFSPDELNVDNLNATNLFTQLTNATGLATDANGKIIAGSGTTYSNLTETGYVSGFRSNVVVTGNALGTAITPLLSLTNGTAAVSGTQQNSPAFMLGGQGYNTTGSTSAPVSMGFVTVPVQGTTPSGNLIIASSIGGAAPTSTSTYFGSGGALNVGSTISASSAIASGGYLRAAAASQIFWNGMSKMYSPANGRIHFSDDASTGFDLLTFGAGSTTALQYLTTNWPALRVENSTNRVRLGIREGTNTTNFGELTARFVRPIKAGFSTNYTINPKTESTIFWSGTNQILTLPDPTVSPGEELTLVGATTTGSAIATNHNGSVTLKGTLSVSIGATNTVVFRSDGSNWW